ncbi:hypothetical protein AXF42_Ash018539 [Apostasia shenzhenica]|uniref:Methionyl-tRNA synthetase n=1 Tax=Apostasia shenzhenica TaxID=1088818 RepID=A0A2I0APV4_9ASPA|nr:hypothetical protein AXF42_Ash018539 [Apostasia shenzhenica]
MCLVFFCDDEETVVGRQQAPGSCPFCGGAVVAVDVESSWRLCFVPLCFRAKRRFSCSTCGRRLVVHGWK